MRVNNLNKQYANSNQGSTRRLATITTTALALSAALFSLNSFAGAWVGEKGTAYTKLGFSTFSSDEYRGTNPSFVDFDSTGVSLYGEYGLGNKFAVFGSLLNQSYDQRDTELGDTSASGFGDVEIGLRYQWQAEPFVLSTSFLIKTPALYSSEDGLGNNQNDYEAKVLLGKGLNKFGYLGMELGYRVRAGEPSDEYRYLLEYGFSVGDSLYFRTKLDGILSANNAESAAFNAENLSNPLEFDAGKLELTTGWTFGDNSSLKGYGAEFTYTREIYGHNILQGNRFELGLTKVF
jgi:hypothetical protein